MLILEMSSQTTLSLLVYAIYSVTDTYFLSVGINSLAAAGASIISPVLMALGGVATTVGAGGASAVSRALGEAKTEKASRMVANTFLIFWTVSIALTVFGALFIRPIVSMLGSTDSVAPYAIEYRRIIVVVANIWRGLIVGDRAVRGCAIVIRLYSRLNRPQARMIEALQPVLGDHFWQEDFDRVDDTLFYHHGASAVYGQIV